MTCSFQRFFVSQIPHISFKSKLDMFLTPIPLPTSFILIQILLVFLLSKMQHLHSYIFQLILNTNIYKRKKISFYYLHKVVNNIIYTHTQKKYLHKVVNNF